MISIGPDLFLAFNANWNENSGCEFYLTFDARKAQRYVRKNYAWKDIAGSLSYLSTPSGWDEQFSGLDRIEIEEDN